MTTYEYGFSVESSEPVKDSQLVKRVAAAYRKSVREFPGHGGSGWAGLDDHKADYQKAIQKDDFDSLAVLLRDPGNNKLFWGFDWVSHKVNPNFDGSASSQALSGREHYDALVKVAIGVGAIRAPHPEVEPKRESSVEEILACLDNKLGFRVDFPNPFAWEFGLVTSRGIASYRAIQALYQAWRLKQVTTMVGGERILEIGAGLGRNVYYAVKLGLNDYTVVDIPLTQLAQGYFLGRTLGDNAIGLCGEETGSVRLRSPAWLHNSKKAFDVILNVDSLTELDRKIALDYVKVGRDRARAFYSINHENNPFSVADLLDEASMSPAFRLPYWPRGGYVEELAFGRLMNAKRNWASRLLGFESREI